MNAADWDFLKPWLAILAPVVFVPDANKVLNGSDKDAHATLQPRVRYLGIDPFRVLISGMFSAGGTGGLDVDKLFQIGSAMELVALALRVEPRVWGLIRDRSGKPLVDMTAFDPEQLGAGLLVKCEGVEMIGQAYGALFFRGDGGTFSAYQPGQRSLPYKADREKLKKMFYTARTKTSPYEYQIPLAITIARTRGDVPISAMHKFFDAVAMSMNVETAVPPGMLQTGWATYRLKDVYIEACDGTRAEMARLEGSGVSITGATNAQYMTHETLGAVVESGSRRQQLKAIDVRLTDSDGVPRLYTALSRGQHIGALSVEISAKQDLTPVAHVLLLTNSKCSVLHRLDIDARGSQFDAQACEALAKAVDVASNGPRRKAHLLKKVDANGPKGTVLPLLESVDAGEKKVLVVLPDGNAIEVVRDAVEPLDDADTSEPLWTAASSIETFSLKANAADDHTAMAIVNLLQRCLPRSLKSLTLEIGAIDDACLRVILESFPELKTLRVKDASVTTTEPLLDAYKSGSCKIEALELGAYGLEVGGLLSALADASTTVAKTLKQLQLNCPYDDEPREEFLSALKKMLRADQSLEFVKICKVGEEDKAEIDAQLSEFRGVAVPMKGKLALVSAIRATSDAASSSSVRALQSLDCRDVNTIMQMAGTARSRVVCVE